MRVLITDRAWPDVQIEEDVLKHIGAQVVDAESQPNSSLVELARDVDAIAACWAPVSHEMLDAAPSCRVVSRFGIGLDNIPIDECTRRGIVVSYVPDYCIPEVADHTIALLLGLLRNIVFLDQQIKQGVYDLSAAPSMSRLQGQTLGLVGFGRIARAVRFRAVSLGLRVVATSASGNDHGTGCPMVTLDELLSTSDLVSLHCPLTDSTHHLLDETALASMKSHAVVVNTSRGALIDHHAAWNALQQGNLGGLALDVYDPEPPNLKDPELGPLFRDPRVVATPHAAFLSRESVAELRRRTAQAIVDVVEGRQPEQVVNPSTCESLGLEPR